MKATVKPGNLPATYLPPTKAVHVLADPHNAYFADDLRRENEKRLKAQSLREKEIESRSWQKTFKKRSPRKWTQEDVEIAERLRDEGHSLSYIADKLGVTYFSVQSKLRIVKRNRDGDQK